MAEQIAGMGGCLIDLETVQTNIVIFRPEGRTAAEIVAGLKAQGVLCGTASAEEVRFVTHRDVDRAACERAVSALREVLEARAEAWHELAGFQVFQADTRPGSSIPKGSRGPI